jgi:DNA-binding transcriptional LysR family regulator
VSDAQAAERRRPAGRRPIREQLSHAARIAEMMMGLPAGRASDFLPVQPEVLRLGVGLSLSTGRLRALLRTYRLQSPEVELGLAALPRDEIVRRVKSGDLDVGFVSRGEPSRAFKVEELWSEGLFVVLAATHPLARHNAIDPASLAGEVLLTTCLDLDAPEQLLTETLPSAPTLALQPVEADRETLFNMVALGFGVAFTSASALGAYYPGIVYRPLLGCGGAVRYAALWRDDNRHAALPGFVKIARAMAERPEASR